jgi:hypothetical protein
MSDRVHQPEHYLTGGIECIEAMEAMMSKQEYKGYLRGNVFKYLWRYQTKNGVEDLRKAKVYLTWLIEQEVDASEF